MLIQAILSILLLLILLALSIPAISKVFGVQLLMAFVVSPLILIAWTAAIHNLLVVIGRSTDHIVAYADSSRVSIFAWALVSIIFIFVTHTRPFIRHYKLGESGLLPLLLVTFLSFSAWVVGIGPRILSPVDNDALSNAFISSRMLTQQNQFLCTLSNDTTLDVNLRFESCGSFILTHTSNMFGLFTNDQAITLAFLLLSIFLPLGAAAAWRSMGGKSSEAWIASISAILFLMYPYALNGLLRLSLSLAFLLPVSALILDERDITKSHFSLLAISFTGLGYIHLLTLSVAIILFLLKTVATLIQSINMQSVLVSVRACLKLIFASFSALLPVYFIFYRSQLVRSSVDGVLAAATAIAPARPVVQPAYEIATTQNWFLEKVANVFQSIFGIVPKLLFDTEWTRAQPILACLVFVGMAILIRRRSTSVFIYLSMTIALFFLLISTELSDREFWISRVLFLNEWYRLLGVLLVLCVLPMAVSISFIFNKTRRIGLNSLFFSSLIVVLLVSLGTGSSIIRTAWTRDRPISIAFLNKLDEIRPWADLRTLNDPSDGSAWLFSRLGSNIAFPNDRGEFIQKGKIVSSVASKSDVMKFKSLVMAENAVAVLGIGSNADKVRRLDDFGLIQEWLINKDALVLGLLNR